MIVFMLGEIGQWCMTVGFPMQKRFLGKLFIAQNIFTICAQSSKIHLNLTVLDE